ncbi:MAG TPA: hypothetical protein VJT31_07080 [Rugosimonospora sp.]|nr:hypothetical protein [Rugosimonospora sp.]
MSGGNDVLAALHASVGEVSMRATADEIERAGRIRRRRRTAVRVAAGGVVAGGVAVTALGLAAAHGTSSTAPPGPAVGGVHVHEAAFTVDTLSTGAVRVTWDKQRYFEDRAGLEAALRRAGMPVAIRVGEFCLGPGDNPALDPAGVGPGVDRVMRGEPGRDGRVTFVFTPSAVPAGKQLFIGYLNPAQLAVTHGRPGSVERLVSATGPLTCTTTPPPARP